MFGRKKKNAEEPTKKAMSSADSRAVEEMLAQAKAQQTLSLDELGGVAGGVAGGVVGRARTLDLSDFFTPIKASGKSKEECLKRVPFYVTELCGQFPDITRDQITNFIEQRYDQL